MGKMGQFIFGYKYILITILCLVIVSVAGVLYINKNKEISLELKDNDNIVIEYGDKYIPLFDDLVNILTLSDNEKNEIISQTTIITNIKNEEGKDYPAIGKYKISIKYNKQKLTKNVIIKDTKSPVFNDTNEITVTQGSSNYDLNSDIGASDLSPVTITYDTTSLDVNTVGDYTIKAFAEDSSGNKSEKDITVKIVSGVSGMTYSGTGKVICIDAGHQARGNSSKEPNGPGSSVMKAKVTDGASGVSTGNSESSVNLSVAIKLQQILSSRGYAVVMCRTSQDVNISNVERATIANNANADVFIRLHCDSFDSSGVTGTTTLAPSTSNPYCSNIANESQRLAKCVLNNTCASTGSKRRGVSITDTMTGLNWSKVPVTIIEMGFMSNPNEDRLLGSSDYQDKLAIGMANGIGEFLK